MSCNYTVKSNILGPSKLSVDVIFSLILSKLDVLGPQGFVRTRAKAMGSFRIHSCVLSKFLIVSTTFVSWQMEWRRWRGTLGTYTWLDYEAVSWVFLWSPSAWESWPPPKKISLAPWAAMISDHGGNPSTVWCALLHICCIRFHKCEPVEFQFMVTPWTWG